MSRLNINNLTNENEDGAPKISGISTFSSTHYFVPPSGSTAERPSHADPGMMRFNTDSGHLEYYNGVEWTSVIANNYQVGISTNPAGTSGGLGHRGVTAGGYVAPLRSAVVDYVTISSLGNAISFGSLNVARSGSASCASATRGLFGGGFSGVSPNQSNTIDYITIASTGTVSTFGILSTYSETRGSCSSETRGLFGGGYLSATPSNSIEYVTISSTGNTVDFGDLTAPGAGIHGCSSSTRGIFAGGYSSPSTPSSNRTNAINFITISTTGNALDFGDLSTARGGGGSSSNSTRGLFVGGQSIVNIIEFIIISTTGNAQDFGDLNYSVQETSGGMASPTRALFAGGHGGSGTQLDNIDYVTILSTGNAQDFGDLTVGRRGPSSCSNGHGGL